MDLSRFERFAADITRLEGPRIQANDLGRFLLETHGDVSIYYAPFDWTNPSARVVVVGITPGRDSMEAAFVKARAILLQGGSHLEAAQAAKQTGSFSNMRGMISKLLDEIGLQKALGLVTCAELFSTRSDLLHPTSCVRYPVFRRGENYTGSSPPLDRFAPFRPYLTGLLAEELAQLPKALVVPCGVKVAAALDLLVQQGKLDPDRMLTGFPHASGANGHLGRIWREEREQLRVRLERWASAQ